MPKTENRLCEILNQRLSNVKGAHNYVNRASEVVVFGSMSAGLERPDSDIDVLCVGDCEYKLKADLIDLIVVPSETTQSARWLQSELATHVGKYGIWIGGVSFWKEKVRVGPRAVDEKRHRVSAFIKSLQSSWFRLDGRFHLKYSIKLRRETQRLLLLERGIAVPPTSILDHSWVNISNSYREVGQRLEEFASSAPAKFVDDLLTRVDLDMESSWVRNHGGSLTLSPPEEKLKGRTARPARCSPNVPAATV
jgi:predicted nucleotidyltransferase